MYFLGIDIGTTSTKALLLSDQLKIVAEGSLSYPIHFVGGGGVEQDPADWWNACCTILQGFWRRGIDPREVAGIAVSGHGVSLVVTDERGEIIRPAISSLDTRCKPQTGRIRQSSRELILQINGNDVGAFNFEPKLLWLKEMEPEHYAKMPCFLSATSYITFRLTGQRCINLSDGGISMAFDRRRGDRWSREIVESIGINLEKYPKLVPCGQVVGTVHEEAAKVTGLPAGIPVLAGGEDTSSAALSVGITKPGHAYISLGTQGTVGVCTDKFEVRPEILGFPHVLPGLSLLSGSMSTFGAGLQWFARECGKDLTKLAEQDQTKTVYDLLMDLCESTEPGSRGLLFLPYLSGELHPILDENAAGVFLGLKMEHTREEMARAVMEGCAHAIRHNLYYAEQVSGMVEELRAVGGPTRSQLWCQIIADITQRPVKVIGVRGGQGGAPLGNALLVMNSIAGADVKDLLANCLVVEREYTPSTHLKDMYDSQHELYRELYIRLRDLFPLLGGIRLERMMDDEIQYDETQ